MITNRLIDHAISKAGGRKIKDIRTVLNYTAVMLDDDVRGLAYTKRAGLLLWCNQ
ncbi:MAG: DUF4213 domain-containing protein [Chloroflexi bacterium]|nr:DUF4213 domain-containing protein [Chloroflexota bacterium]